MVCKNYRSPCTVCHVHLLNHVPDTPLVVLTCLLLWIRAYFWSNESWSRFWTWTACRFTFVETWGYVDVLKRFFQVSRLSPCWDLTLGILRLDKSHRMLKQRCLRSCDFNLRAQASAVLKQQIGSFMSWQWIFMTMTFIYISANFQ